MSYRNVKPSAGSKSRELEFISEIEVAILRSDEPIVITESEEINVLGHRGIWANRNESNQWKGAVPLSEYKINEDQNPEIIRKTSKKQLEYIQELAIRYLKPPTPPTPGDIIITQSANELIPPAPPLIIRQQPARAVTPEPLVIREAPPNAPNTVGRKIIKISGKQMPPPPRKVVIERLAALPSRPQPVIVERWLPYGPAKRKVVFYRTRNEETVVAKPRNVIVQWETPQVHVKKEIKYLGVIRANPDDYVAKFGASLRQAKDLPQFVLDIKTPADVGVLAADCQRERVHVLEGAVEALRLVDLDREGLSEYKKQLKRYESPATNSFSLASSLASSVTLTGQSWSATGSEFDSNISSHR